MTEDTASTGARYWAFVSYSHKDAVFGRRLHRRLENYVLPRRLVGRNTTNATVPKRLHPVFRDREEFAAAGDLSAEVRAALAASQSLVVVCSPAAAASRWVTREVELFRVLHPDRPVLAAICEGEPAQSLPEALRRTGADGVAIEPLAADFRRGRDGAELGLLKLVAGILDVGLDELVQRDASRRLQRVTAVTAAALAAMIGMGALTLFALNARSEAERQRGKAEGLVEFMLTDLRNGLKGVGRLDLMTAVNQRALQYYGDEDLAGLPADSLERRARILNNIGEDDMTLGRTNAALATFQEAHRTTASLLAADPNNPERIFDHAQSEYWIGYHNYSFKRYAAARAAFLAYKRLAERLVAMAPKDARSFRELGFAEGDLCTVALKPPKDVAEGLRECTAAVAHMETAQRLRPSSDTEAELANEISWLADAYRTGGDRKRAIAERLVQKRILDRLIAADPHNMMLRTSWIALQRVLARMEAEAGHPDAGLARLKQTGEVLDQMIAFDPSNKSWAGFKTKLALDVSEADAMQKQAKSTKQGENQ